MNMRVTSARVSLLAILFSLTISHAALSISLPPKADVFAPDEVRWFGVCGDFLVLQWGDNTISVLNLETSGRVSMFSLPDYREEGLGDPQLSLSVMGEPQLAVTYGGSPNGVVDFYNLQEGKLRERAVIEKLTGCRGYGFSRDGKRFFCVSYMDAQIIILDVKRGYVVRRTDCPELIRTGIAIFADGRLSAQFTYGPLMIVDAEGTVLARKSPPEGEFIEPAQWDSPSRPYFITFVSRDELDVGAFRALDDKGNIVWNFSGNWTDLLAASPDGARQVVAEGGKLLILDLPGNDRVVTDESPSSVDVAFAKDGAWLLCFPSAKAVTEYEQSVTYARPSHSLRILDVKTGRKLREIDIRRPLDVPLGKQSG